MRMDEGWPSSSISKSGWMDARNFLMWFKRLLLLSVSHLTESAPFLDGHHFYISLELIKKKSRDSNIFNAFWSFVSFPHTTLLPIFYNHLMWECFTSQGCLEGDSQEIKVSRDIFPSFIARIWDTSFKPEHCRGRFLATCLVPFSPAHVLSEFAPTAIQENDM